MSAVLVEVDGLVANGARQRQRARRQRWKQYALDVRSAHVTVGPARADDAGIRFGKYRDFVGFFDLRLRVGGRGALQTDGALQTQSVVARHQHRVVKQLLADGTAKLLLHGHLTGTRSSPHESAITTGRSPLSNAPRLPTSPALPLGISPSVPKPLLISPRRFRTESLKSGTFSSQNSMSLSCSQSMSSGALPRPHLLSTESILVLGASSLSLDASLRKLFSQRYQRENSHSGLAIHDSSGKVVSGKSILARLARVSVLLLTK